MSIETLSFKFSLASFIPAKDVVLVACTKDGLALRFASHRLRQDQEVVLVAAARNGMTQLADTSMIIDTHIIVE